MKRWIVIYTPFLVLSGLIGCQSHLSTNTASSDVQACNENNPKICHAHSNEGVDENNEYKVKKSLINHQGCTITEYENGSVAAVCPDD